MNTFTFFKDLFICFLTVSFLTVGLAVTILMISPKLTGAELDIPNKDRMVITNCTKETDFFIFVITDRKTNKDFLYIRSAANSSSLIKLSE